MHTILEFYTDRIYSLMPTPEKSLHAFTKMQDTNAQHMERSQKIHAEDGEKPKKCKTDIP